jgi:hypothetical protein
MRVPDLAEYLDAVEEDRGLELPIGGRTYRVRPPSVARGLRLVRFAASSTIDDLAERRAEQAAALGDDDLPTLALGADVVAQLDADDVPAALVGEATTVALITWTRGQQAAETYVQRKLAARAGGDASGEAPTPAPTSRRRTTSTTSRSRKRNGTGTASG